MHSVPAAAAAAGTAYTGKWLFDYNRANFQYDVPQRFGRYMTSRGMLNTQVGQYRQDVHGIAELTSSKMETVQAMMTLTLCVCAALSDAGRIGMHGCAPPQWLCALYSGPSCPGSAMKLRDIRRDRASKRGVIAVLVRSFFIFLMIRPHLHIHSPLWNGTLAWHARLAACAAAWLNLILPYLRNFSWHQRLCFHWRRHQPASTSIFFNRISQSVHSGWLQPRC